MWLLHFSMKKLAGAALNARTCLSSLSQARQESKLTSYDQAVNSRNIRNRQHHSKADMEKINFKQPAGQNTIEYAQDLWTKALRYRPIFGEYRLKGTVIEGLKQSIRKSVGIYWAKNKVGTAKRTRMPRTVPRKPTVRQGYTGT